MEKEDTKVAFEMKLTRSYTIKERRRKKQASKNYVNINAFQF